MDPQNYIRVLTIIFLSLLLHPPSRTEAKSSTELIDDVCELSKSNQKFCLETLNSNPKTQTAKDHKALAEISLQMTKVVTTKMSTKFKRLSAKHKGSRAALEQCAKYFEEAVGMLNLGGLDGGTASLDIHYASDNCQYCENALSKAGVKIRSIPPAIKKWRDTFTIAMAAVTTAEGDVEPQY